MLCSLVLHSDQMECCHQHFTLRNPGSDTSSLSLFFSPSTPLYSTKPSLAMLWTFSLQHHSMSQLAWPSYAYCAQRGGKSSPCRWQAPSELSWCVFIYTKLYIPSADERGWSVEHWHLFCSFTSWVFTTWFTAKLPFSLTIQCYL